MDLVLKEVQMYFAASDDDVGDKKEHRLKGGNKKKSWTLLFCTKIAGLFEFWG